MPDKFYYYGPPPSPEDMEGGINIIKLLFGGFLWLVMIGVLVNYGGPTIESWLNGIGNHNINDILIMLLILFIVSLTLLGAIFIMRGSEHKLGCIVFIALCLVMLLGGIGISAWELLRPPF